MTTLVAGVIVAGVGSNANPHALESHTDAALSSPSNGDIIRYVSSTGKWTKTNPSTLPSPSHSHDGVYVTPSDLTPFAPKANPPLTGTVTISGDTPKIVLNETDGSFSSWVNEIRMDTGGMFFKVNGEDTRKIENRFVDYQSISLGLPSVVVTADHTASNPGCVRYIDASGGNIVISLQAVGNYYRTVTRETGVVLFFVRQDSSANTVTIVPNGSDTIDGASSITLADQKSFAVLQATSTGWKVIASNTSEAGDTGWQNMTNLKWSNVASYPTGMGSVKTPQARKINNTVYLRGSCLVGSTPSNGENLARLPSGMEPTRETLIVVPSYSSSSRFFLDMIIKTDGYIAVHTTYQSVSTAQGGFWFDTISFAR